MSAVLLDQYKTVFFGCDHAGLALKKPLFDFIQKNYPGVNLVDLGTSTPESTDYPVYAQKVAQRVADGQGVGILICGSGTGMAIAANRHKGVRAANVWDEASTLLSREHNNTNILCLGARFISLEKAKRFVGIWFETSYEGGRHQHRLDIMDRVGSGGENS